MKRLLAMMFLMVGFSFGLVYSSESLTDDMVASMTPKEAIMFASFLNQNFPPTEDVFESNGAGADFFNNRYRRVGRRSGLIENLSATVDFRGLYLDGFSFHYCNLRGSNFSGVRFWDNTFLVCKLDKTVWRKVYMGNVVFRGISQASASNDYPAGETTMREAVIDASGAGRLISFQGVDMTLTQLLRVGVDPANSGDAVFVFANCNMSGFYIPDPNSLHFKSVIFRNCINLDRNLYDAREAALRQENGQPYYSQETEYNINSLLMFIMNLLGELIKFQVNTGKG